ncbi:hypothetical protein [Paenibacillus sinopodophylli]|uniref:hypothetical protein n=1 Tax=Paenibacillus sinopodophylli TaxID=1837342 RepID=UPI00110D1861|nr:hypothetical protein [Paenibacillus sinopodophylli]
MGCIRTVKNRSTTPLGSNATYEGPVFKSEMYNQIRGLVSANQSGTISLQESFDGVTWYQSNTAAVTGGTPAAFRFYCHAYYARIVYVNGATAQGSFDLQAYADPFGA